jgi:predicted nucleotidyltransferase/HEPN domain-containing protein
MKSSIKHLPPEKIKELESAVSVIREMCDDLEMIILFGSHARGDYRDEDDLAPDRKSGWVSDFDILAVTGTEETAKDGALWHRISERCNGLDPYMPFRIIAHDIVYMKKRLKRIHYFFSDIVREGCLLYSSGKYQLNVRKELLPEQKYEVAQEHFDNWFESATDFFDNFEYRFSKRGYKNAAFQLHQAAESSYKAFLLVMTNYVPHDHYLSSADKQVQELFPDMEQIFPCKNKEEEERFKNFDYAYIGARYDSKFKISVEDLEYFSKRVKRLLELTEKMCKEKIASYKTLTEKA